MAWYETSGADIFWRELPDVNSSFVLSGGGTKSITVTKMPRYIVYSSVAYTGTTATTRAGVLKVGDPKIYNVGYISSGKVNEEIDVSVRFTSITSSSVVVKLVSGAYDTRFTVSIWY